MIYPVQQSTKFNSKLGLPCGFIDWKLNVTIRRDTINTLNFAKAMLYTLQKLYKAVCVTDLTKHFACPASCTWVHIFTMQTGSRNKFQRH